MNEPMATIAGFVVWRLLGLRAVQAMRKVHFGFLDAKTPDEVAAHARERYEAYYREVRASVPATRLLKCRLGDGWEPLCAFLDEENPRDMDSPRENDKLAHGKEANAWLYQIHKSFMKVTVPPVIVSAAVVIAWRARPWNRV